MMFGYCVSLNIYINFIVGGSAQRRRNGGSAPPHKIEMIYIVYSLGSVRVCLRYSK